MASFEGPQSVMSRLMGLSSGMMGGAGGRTSASEMSSGGVPTQIVDATPTGVGDSADQLAARITVGVATGTGSKLVVESPLMTKTEGTDAASHPSGSSGAHKSSLTDKAHNALSSLKAGLSSSLSGVGGSAGELLGLSTGRPTMTSAWGQQYSDPTHSVKAAGCPLVSDLILMEKQQTFNRAKILERPVHACGSGAMGFFECTHDVSDITKAEFLTKGKVTPVAARFSTTTLGREFPDEARNPRGLAFKFYTEQGNFDLMSINFPTFFVRDGILGPDAIRSQQRNPASFEIDFAATFDFMALVPESMLANLWFWSDHGTPRGWMHMDGYPVHTFKWLNSDNKVTYVKYKLVSQQGIVNFTQAEAQRMCGVDPDFSKREMFQHIASGNSAEWVMYVQTMDEQQAAAAPIDIFDGSKVWPEEAYPYREVGRITLNRNPENFHRDIEQIAFSPGRLVPGIEPSQDPLLQFRVWLYQDSQYHRLGVNYHQIPVNCPFMARNYHPQSRDGAQRTDHNGAMEPHYFPNSFPRCPALSLNKSSPDVYAPQPDVTLTRKPMPLGQDQPAVIARSFNSRHEGSPRDDYVQATQFYEKALSATDKASLHYNIAFSLKTVGRKEVVLRFLLSCYRTSPALAEGVMEALTAEYAAFNKQPPISWSQIQQVAESLKDKPLVDVNNAYEPVPLPM